MELFDYEEEHLKRVRKGLPECMVLLKSDGTFPLEQEAAKASESGRKIRVAAYGNGVRHSVKGGTGSGEVNSRFSVNFEQGLTEAGFELTSKNWLDDYDCVYKKAKENFKRQIKAEAREKHASLFAYAMGVIMPEPEYEIPLVFEGEVAIYILSRISGEGNDRRVAGGDLFLTKTEIRDILELNCKFNKFMLVINTGGPVDLSPVMDVKNILVVSQLGVQMGSALADVLLGKAYPSGKLTTTWSAWQDYCPDIDFGNVEKTYYREGVYVGYRYFDTVGKRAMFPFGYGLGYTHFDINEVEVSSCGSAVTITARVTNLGTHPGKEVVQAYVTPPEKNIKKPYQSLACYVKTAELKGNDSEIVKLEFNLADLASYDETRHFMVLEDGDYIIRLGNSSVDTKPVAVINLNEDVVVTKVRQITTDDGIIECEYERAPRHEELTELPVIKLTVEDFTTVTVGYDKEVTINPLAKELSDEELAIISIGHFSKGGGLGSIIGNAASHVVGAAGETTSELEHKKIKPIIMADGPAGLRLAREYYQDKKGRLRAVGNADLPESMIELMTGPFRLLCKLVLENKPPKDAKIMNQYCTAIPIGTAIAQSFNLDYAKECGDIVGDEMERFGVNLWLAPALNIHRSILCGRNFEYFSEDPLVSGLVAAAITKGVQAHPGCGVTIKHYACNNQETNRYYSNSIMSERALREIYLRGFGICVRESQPAAVMTSYNLLNGLHTAESRPLIEDYLRAENDYQGIVMTDWVVAMIKSLGGQYRNSLSHEVAKAGGDVFMPGCMADYKNVLNALKSGELPRRQLEQNATRIINMSNKLCNIDR